MELGVRKNIGRSRRVGGGLRRVRGLRRGPRGRGLGLGQACQVCLRGLRGGGRRRERLKERIRKKKMH